MICPVCKSNIREDAVFCPVCGKPVPLDSPDIHKIETVELPKNAEVRVQNLQYQKNSQAELQKSADKPVQH